MTASRRRWSWLLAIAVASPGLLHAQAFGLNEIGACAVGRGFANTGAPCVDASMIYWNPAATTQLSGWSASLGGTLISVKARFTRDTSLRKYDADPPTSFPPSLFLNYHPANSKLSWGVGAYVPYGLTSQWKSDFPGRFLAEKASISSPYIQPNVAYKINDNWSVGGGPIIGFSSVELEQAVDASAQAVPGLPITFASLGVPRYTQFANADLKGSAVAVGAQIGISGKVGTNTTFGARFMLPMYFKYSGAKATFTQVPTGDTLAAGNPYSLPAGTPFDALFTPQFASDSALGSGKASTMIVHPAQIEGGFGYSGFKNWLLDLDYDWVGWKQFSNITVTFSNPKTPTEHILVDYNNTSSLRFGAERSFSDSLKIRAGYAYAASAAPPETVTPLIPEQDRQYYNLGATIPMMANWGLDVAYSHIWTGGARGRIDDRTSEAQTAAQLNSGVYNLSANIFSLTLRYNH